MQQLHARVDDRSHVELTDTDEEVVVQPYVDLRSQLVHVDGRRRRGDLDDDVDEAIDVVGSRGDRQILELAFAHRRDATDVPEIEDRDVCPVGKQEVSRLGVGVIERIPEDHLEVYLGGRRTARRRPTLSPRRSHDRQTVRPISDSS